jgi:two-component system sensor histidine kinase YcbA
MWMNMFMIKVVTDSWNLIGSGLIQNKFISYLFMIFAVPIAGELKFFPIQAVDLRVSLGTPVFFFILLWSRKIQPIFAGIVTGTSVVFFRVLLDSFKVDSFQFKDSFGLNFPVFFYYVVFSVLFYLFRINHFYNRPIFIGIFGMIMETAASLTEFFIRDFAIHTGITANTLSLFGGIAIIRSFFVLGFFNILLLRETRLAEEQQRKKSEQILLFISNLYIEMFQLKKTTKNAEVLTNSCYLLYRGLKELNAPEQANDALKIAGELHEIKKDNQRIYAGLSKLMVKEKLSDFMKIEEMVGIITRSNQNYGEMLGKKINFEIRISGEHPPYHTFILFSLINNLVANSVEAIDKAGHVILTIERINDSVKINIEDNGSGIAPKNKLFIFEPGFTTKFDHNGIASNGIGLSFIKNIIENNGGTITLIDSTNSAGAIFEILFPLASLTEKG